MSRGTTFRSINSPDLGFALLAFTSMLAIVNPLGAVPVYVTLTGDYTRERRLATLRAAIVTAVTVLVVFALAGPWILRFFGVTTDAFRITGGVLMLGIGYDMVRAKRGPLVMLVAWLVLRIAPAVLLRVGRTGVNVLTRLMGLLVMVIGMQFVITGIESVAGR